MSVEVTERSLTHLLKLAGKNSEFARLVASGGRAYSSRSLRAYLIAALLVHEEFPQGPALVVAPDDGAARELAHDLGAWLTPRVVRFYPSRGVTYESHLAPPPHLVGLRTAALDSLDSSDSDLSAVVVASSLACSEKVPSAALRPHGFVLSQGESVDLDTCLKRLVAIGYERVDQVEDRGQVAVRGGILDLFPATEDHAVRLDLFGDEIESIKQFSTFTQRSLGALESVEIAPAAELDLEYRELAELAAMEAADERPDIAELLPVDDFHPLLELLPQKTNVIVSAAEEVGPVLVDSWQDATALFEGEGNEGPHTFYVPPEALSDDLFRRAYVQLSSLDGDVEYEFHAQAADIAARSAAEAEPDLEKLVRSQYRTVVTWPHRGDGERAAYGFARLRAVWEADRLSPGSADALNTLDFVQADLNEGFIAPQFELAVVPSHRLVRRRTAAVPGTARRRRGVLRSFVDLAVGDVVVHEDHGVARFAGFQTRTVAGVTRDYLYLEYQGDDRVLVPCEQLDKISRYVGGGTSVQLSKLGGSRWQQLKSRARKAAHELAGELLNLYASRKRSEGYAFPPDSEIQLEFERAFPYRETIDQRDAIEQVKEDMEAPQPMDRLICGDVGFGKTEVALRAVCKAVSAGKQVMVLAPTTVLAQQHYGTFAERFRDYPFNVDHISRFRSGSQQRAALERFAAGKVDILIGTHRLLSGDVRPKNLGLIVVDEEQRFGVKQKELMRQLRLQVDVLAMSATPIPRTLQMSLAGVRDLSVIATPPEGRRPVKTYVGEYDDRLVERAITRELERDGQVFFVHNLVDTIDETATRLRGLCPKASVEVVHGQLDESQLEERMLRFLRGDANVLVCTSIVESGLDIPQANTLIVERADVFGLSQLYQIRGRVGRSSERAYAYLLYPSAATLTSEAAQRLAALSDYTELGSGFKIAMRDLEIRGAGNLLGDEQSGHVAALGFELYMQMIDEAVSELEGVEFEDQDLVKLDVSVDAYLPADYIPYERAKIDFHRRIAAAREVSELAQIRAELEDRFGPLPDSVENLMTLQELRTKLGTLGVRTVTFKAERFAMTPVELNSTQLKKLREDLPEARYESGRSQLSIRVPNDPAARLKAARSLVDALLTAV